MYIALDIETTGLDPDIYQVLEIALVADVPGLCVRDCPVFHAVIDPGGSIIGDPPALAMNAALIASIGRGNCEKRDRVMKDLDRWLTDVTPRDSSGCPTERKPYTLLGKNVGSFDWQFVKRLPGFPVHRFDYRFMDVGSLYAEASGLCSQADLVAKQSVTAYAIPGKEHEAVFDARVSLALARSKWGLEV